MDSESEARTETSRHYARRLVLNPTSGRGSHVERAHELADDHGFTVVETEYAGHATELVEQAVADGVDLLAVCGGDGTIHEVAQGLVAADALDEVTLAVIPAGTENFLARDLGIDDLAKGFEVAERGETRRLDLGFAGDEPFVLSAIAGLPADASAAATHERKRSLGPAAFVVAGIEQALSFDGLRVEMDAISDGEEREWSGEVLAVLVGNVRKFAEEGGQANAEDGLLEVTIVEQMPPQNAVAEAIEQRVFQQETPHVTELLAQELRFESLDGEEITFSLDGEIRRFEAVELGVRPGALRVRVGEEYDPNP